MSDFSLSSLEAIVAERAAASPEHSWTAKLVAHGQAKAAKVDVLQPLRMRRSRRGD